MTFCLCCVCQEKEILFTHSFIPLACAECGDSLPFSGATSILPYHILFPATLLRQLCFHPPSLRPAIYFLVYLLVLLFPNSYPILFWEFYFLPFSARVQTISMHTATLNYITICSNWYFFSNRFKCSGGISDSFGVYCSNRARHI